LNICDADLKLGVNSPPPLLPVNRTAGRQIDTPAKKYLQSGTSAAGAVEAITMGAGPGLWRWLGMQHSGHIGIFASRQRNL